MLPLPTGSYRGEHVFHVCGLAGRGAHALGVVGVDAVGGQDDRVGTGGVGGADDGSRVAGVAAVREDGDQLRSRAHRLREGPVERSSCARRS